MLTVIKDGPSLSVQLSANGAASKVDIVVWRRSPEATLLVDRADVVAADVRAQVVRRLPNDVRTEATDVLEDAALELALRRAERAGLDAAKPADPEPWLEAVDGAALLNAIAAVFPRYLVLPPDAVECLAAFVLVTYAVTAFDVMPYLAVLSPTMRCGKSRLLELLELLVWRPWLTTGATGPVIYRQIERLHPSVLLDEAEVVRHKGDAAAVVRTLLQAGYRRGVKVTRCVGDNLEPHDFDLFAPKVFACIGRLSGTLLDRCVVLEMRRKRRNEIVARFRRRELQAPMLELRRRCRRWAIDNLQNLESSRPELPTALDDRAQELWEPLLAVGSQAGGGWLERLTKAAERLSGERDDESPGAELMADIGAVFAGQRLERVASVDLAKALAELEGRPWADWSHGKPLTANGLARLLKDYGIQPQPMWLDGRTQRGYASLMFADAFSRYLQPQEREESKEHPENLESEAAQGDGCLTVAGRGENPQGGATPYTLALADAGEGKSGHGMGEPRRCSSCGQGMSHYGLDLNTGWVCADCHPDADRAMGGQG